MTEDQKAAYKADRPCRHRDTFDHYDRLTDFYLRVCRECGDVAPVAASRVVVEAMSDD